MTLLACDEFDAMEYSYEDAVCITRSSPEQALWNAVVHQAFVDAINGNKAAKEWLLQEKQDFSTVCNLAGLSPARVRNAAQTLAKSAQ